MRTLLVGVVLLVVACGVEAHTLKPTAQQCERICALAAARCTGSAPLPPRCGRVFRLLRLCASLPQTACRIGTTTTTVVRTTTTTTLVSGPPATLPSATGQYRLELRCDPAGDPWRCGCVSDLTAPVIGSLLLGGPDSAGKVAGWLRALSNQRGLPEGVALLGEHDDARRSEAFEEDSGGYVLRAGQCYPNGCCFRASLALTPLEPPFDGHLLFDFNCEDDRWACTADLRGGVSGEKPTYEFKTPTGVATDGNGNVYVADHGNRIQKLDANGTLVGRWGSEGAGNGDFNYPFGIAIDRRGTVYVADAGNNRIQKFDTNGTFLGTLGSPGAGHGQFAAPRGVAADATGNVYVADTGNNRIQKFDADGTFIITWGSWGAGNGQFGAPVGVATDAGGFVYVADAGNDRIQKFTPNGAFVTRWGSRGSGNGQFLGPSGVAIDGRGQVYVVDTGNDRIQRFDANGAFLWTWGKWGWDDREFYSPIGVAIDGSGRLYVADGDNDRIQKFNTSGLFLAAWPWVP